MLVVTESEQRAAELEAQIAEVCGVINAATGSLVSLVARVIDTGAWEGTGIHSPAHWVAWKCGLSPSRARRLVTMAHRSAELPATFSALAAGSVSEDQVAVVVRHVPPGADGDAAELARHATVSQLRASLSRYSFEPKAKADPTKDEGERDPDEGSQVSFGADDDDIWRLNARLAPDQGATVERALGDARQWLFDHRDAATAETDKTAISWVDALLLMAERSLAAGARIRPYQDRHQVIVHLDTKDPTGTRSYGHGGLGLPETLRRLLACDARIKPVWETQGRPVSVGRSLRIVPDRTRSLIEDRDRGCRVPGCDRTRWSQIHHIVHWQDGGTTDTANLLSLCSAHHRAHHQGRLAIAGDADEPNGVVFRDARGRVLKPSGTPTPPRRPPPEAARALGIPTDGWHHPSGERLDSWGLYLNETG